MTNTKFSDMPLESLKRYLFKHASGKLSTDIDGESVIMDLATGNYSSFNPVGSLIWNELHEGNGFSQVLESILDRFEVDEEVAQKELLEFLDLLFEKKLITATDTTEQT